MFFGFHYNFIKNNMNDLLLIKESRLFLEQPTKFETMLSLKVCIDRDIYKFHNLQWNSQCNRWQALSQMRISFHPQSPIEFQLFYSDDNKTKVIGQGFIAATIVKQHLNEEIKISLTYDGLIVGYLYCEFSFEKQTEGKSMNNKYLYLHKISFTFLQDLEQQFRLQIMQNTEPIYSKAFILTQRSKTIFPNIKKAVRLSDVIAIQLYHPDHVVKSVIFLVDHIKRGKTTFFQAWLRNKYKNKMGHFNLEYFLENIYLENERRVFSRKAIIPNSEEHIKTRLVTKEVEQEKEELEKAKKIIKIKKIEEADKRILKVNNDLNKMINQIRINEHAMPCLRRQQSNKPEDVKHEQVNKEKISFYFSIKQ